MNVIESKPQSMTEQAVEALQAFEPMVDSVLSYVNLTVAEDGIGKVEEAHKAVKRLRVDLDKKRKELNEGALSYQRTVNATAKMLTEKISKVESKLEAEREQYESEKLREKQAKEAAKQAILNERVRMMSELGIVVNELSHIAAMTDEEFAFVLDTESRRAAEAKAEKLRLEAEAKAEADRLEALRQEELKRQAEELRIRAAEIERQRIADETAMAEERARLKAEREAAEARLEAERRLRDAERAELEAEERKRAEEAAARLAEERKAAAERLRSEREQIDAERAAMRRQQEELNQHQAKLRAEAEAEAAEKRRQEIEAERQRKEAAAAPELEKLEAVLKAMRNAGIAAIEQCGHPAWAEIVKQQFSELCDSTRKLVRDSL